MGDDFRRWDNRYRIKLLRSGALRYHLMAIMAHRTLCGKRVPLSVSRFIPEDAVVCRDCLRMAQEVPDAEA